MANLLASLHALGIVERTGLRLRVTPRFLAHAEGTAGRLHLLGQPQRALDVALASWGPVPEGAATVVADLMDRHDQWGMVHPVFPPCVAAV